MHSLHLEFHRSHRVGWLRASVLGANDGVVSVSSLVVGVAAAGASASDIFLTGMAGLVAGALSMAAGEYISVQSQADTEAADLAKERQELIDEPEKELQELTHIYVERGLDPTLARQVAEKLTEVDALGTHLRDELGINENLMAKPVQAALASAAAFGVGGAIPILAALTTPFHLVGVVTTISTLITLSILGAIAAKTGGASMIKGAARVVFWGALAMAVTALVGRAIGREV